MDKEDRFDGDNDATERGGTKQREEAGKEGHWVGMMGSRRECIW